MADMSERRQSRRGADRRRDHERDLRHGPEGAGALARRSRCSRPLHDCAQESSAGLEQRRHRPRRQLRAELHAPAPRRQRRHRQGAGGQHRVRHLAAALGASGEEGRDPRSPRLHPSLPAHELRLGARERRLPQGALRARCRRTIATTAWSTARTRQVIAGWAPLIIEGRKPRRADRRRPGSSPERMSITAPSRTCWSRQLAAQPGFAVHYNRKVVALDRVDDGRWAVTVEDTYDATRRTVDGEVRVHRRGRRLAAAAAGLEDPGGARLRRLSRSRASGCAATSTRSANAPPRARSTARRPRARRRCRCPTSTPASSAASARCCSGPTPGFSSRFLKHGSLTDLFTALTPHNVVPLLDVAKDNVALDRVPRRPGAPEFRPPVRDPEAASSPRR